MSVPDSITEGSIENFDFNFYHSKHEGLHNVFGFTEDKIDCGFMDMIFEYKELLRSDIEELPEPLTDISQYIKKVDLSHDNGSISLIPFKNFVFDTNEDTIDDLSEKKFISDYNRTIDHFDWDNFYCGWHGSGYIEYLKKQFKEKADVILIDGGSGFNTLSSIAVLRLADINSIQFGYNGRNLESLERVIRSINGEDSTLETWLNPSLISMDCESQVNEWETKIVAELKFNLPDLDTATLRANTMPYDAKYTFVNTDIGLPSGGIYDAYLRIAEKIASNIKTI